MKHMDIDHCVGSLFCFTSLEFIIGIFQKNSITLQYFLKYVKKNNLIIQLQIDVTTEQFGHSVASRWATCHQFIFHSEAVHRYLSSIRKFMINKSMDNSIDIY